MRTGTGTVWLALGAIVGGMVVGLFPPEPRWLWSLIGGVTGGGLGLGAARIAACRWHPALRLLAIMALLLVGFGALFLVVGGQWVTDPRNFRLRTGPGGTG